MPHASQPEGREPRGELRPPGTSLERGRGLGSVRGVSAVPGGAGGRGSAEQAGRSRAAALRAKSLNEQRCSRCSGAARRALSSDSPANVLQTSTCFPLCEPASPVLSHLATMLSSRPLTARVGLRTVAQRAGRPTRARATAEAPEKLLQDLTFSIQEHRAAPATLVRIRG